MQPNSERPDSLHKQAWWLVLWLPAALLAAGTFVANARAAPLDKAEIFFELNNTDGDLGIHALIDGDAWETLKIMPPPPDNKVILQITVDGSARDQGLTELFFESAEPTFDELIPLDFFNRFPEGRYRVEITTLDGPILSSRPQVTHVMPAPPVVFVNGMPAAANCDVAPIPMPPVPVVISWNEVMLSHPDAAGGGAAVQPTVGVTIINYEVVVEIAETPFRTSTILPPEARMFVVPEEFLALGDEIKFEVLAREESFNQTAIESCFKSPLAP